MNTTKPKEQLLPTHLKVTPLVLTVNKKEIVTIYTSNRREAAKALADIVAAIFRGGCCIPLIEVSRKAAFYLGKYVKPKIK